MTESAAWPAWAIQWYSAMCLISLLNVLAYVASLLHQKPFADAALRRYQLRLQVLAAPMVFVAAWRCIFPTGYLERYAWYDCWPCSILLGRCLATVAEVAWVAQLALAVAFVDQSLPSRRPAAPQGEGVRPALAALADADRAAEANGSSSGRGCRLVPVLAWGMVISICCAEVASDFATITKNGLGYALEETLWGVSFSLLCPTSAWLLLRVLKECPRASARVGCCNAVFFTLTTAVVSFGYLVWQWSFHVPQEWNQWRAQLEAGDVFYGFWDGLKDAALERNVTRAYDIWGPSLVWLTGYFSAGVWSSIALTFAPHVRALDASAPLSKA